MYVEDSLGDRVWVDRSDCKGLVDNIITAFNTNLPPKSLLQSEPSQSSPGMLRDLGHNVLLDWNCIRYKHKSQWKQISFLHSVRHEIQNYGNPLKSSGRSNHLSLV